MASATPLHLTAAALLLGVASCNVDKLDITSDLVPPAATTSMDVPPPLLEMHRMFEEEKRRANAGELPAQF